MQRTRIPWAKYTWSPIVGCSPVSEGCEHCYARTMYERFHGKGSFEGPRLAEKELAVPLRLKKPSLIFVGSMTDIFHEDVKPEWLAGIFSTIAAMPRHTYLILTKRPQNIVWRTRPNVWWGVTAENQARVDERIPVLLGLGAVYKFASVEPMLGPVSLSLWLTPLTGIYAAPQRSYMREMGRRALDWVIAGPETGPHKRPCKREWQMDLSRQCTNAGVPFFWKGVDDGTQACRREWPDAIRREVRP